LALESDSIMEKIFPQLENLWQTKISRSRFLRICGAAGLAFLAENKFLKKAFGQAAESGPRPQARIDTKQDLAAVSGADPYKNTVTAVELLGGMELFVKKGATVVVKPNIGWDRAPEQAANTNPAVVAALVEMCYQAGAKRVNVFDVTCNEQRRCYANSGIAAAAQAKGAQVYFPDHWNVVKAKFPYPSPLEGWPILRDAVTCDTFINVPILKHHGITGLTIAMKNLMGVCSGNRGIIHVDISRKLADLADFIRPELTVVDATRVLVRHGPTGGNLNDVVAFDTVFASADTLLADAFACKLLSQDARNFGFIKEAIGRNLGNADLTKARIQAVKI